MFQYTYLSNPCIKNSVYHANFSLLLQSPKLPYLQCLNVTKAIVCLTKVKSRRGDPLILVNLQPRYSEDWMLRLGLSFSFKAFKSTPRNSYGHENLLKQLQANENSKERERKLCFSVRVGFELKEICAGIPTVVSVS